MTTESRIERYYYLKDPTNGHYLGCVCLYRDPETGKFSRGVSLCNTEMDRFIKARARGIAYGRAIHCLGQCYDVGPNLAKKCEVIKKNYGLNLRPNNEMVWLGLDNVILTKFECRMWDDVLNPWPEKAK